MPFSLKDRAAAVNDADFQEQIQGQCLVLAGYIIGGDGELSDTLKAKRLEWAKKVLYGAGGQQHLVDTAAKLARTGAATSGVFTDRSSVSEITDADVASIVGFVMDNEAQFDAL